MEQINYPYVEELITDSGGHVTKVVMNLGQYQKLLDAIEDEALVKAMQESEHETPLSKEDAVKMLEEA